MIYLVIYLLTGLLIGCFAVFTEMRDRLIDALRLLVGLLFLTVAWPFNLLDTSVRACRRVRQINSRLSKYKKDSHSRNAVKFTEDKRMAIKSGLYALTVTVVCIMVAMVTAWALLKCGIDPKV